MWCCHFRRSQRDTQHRSSTRLRSSSSTGSASACLSRSRYATIRVGGFKGRKPPEVALGNAAPVKLGGMLRRIKLFLVLVAVLASGLHLASAQKKEIVWSADEKPIADQIHGLRDLADDVRAGTTKDLALKIRKLPATENTLRLAEGFAGKNGSA